MADTNNTQSATNTILIVLLIIIVLVAGFFLFSNGFGFGAATPSETIQGSLNVDMPDVNVPDGGALAAGGTGNGQ